MNVMRLYRAVVIELSQNLLDFCLLAWALFAYMTRGPVGNCSE